MSGGGEISTGADTTMTTESRDERIAWLKDLHDPDCLYVTHNGACDCLDGVVAERAASRMRDACVAKVREHANVFHPNKDDECDSAAYEALNEAADELESLTLDQVEKKQ